MINLDKEEEKKSEGSDKDSFNVDESDEEDSSVIPDEKQPGDADQPMTNANGDETELDLMKQINALESEEQDLTDQMRQKEALLDKIKQQQKEM